MAAKKQRRLRVLVFEGDELVYQAKVRLGHVREELPEARQYFVQALADRVAAWGRGGINTVRVQRPGRHR